MHLIFNRRLTLTSYPSIPSPQARRSVQEVCTCWALIPVAKCALLGEDTTAAVPLYYGSLYKPQLLAQHQEARRIAKGGLRGRLRQGLGLGLGAARLTFRAGAPPALILIGKY